MARTDTVVVGGGQAGLALSHHLAQAGHDHVVLERGRVGQAWRDRWDSLRLLTPNDASALPGSRPPGEPAGFASRHEVVRHLSEYAAGRGLPVCEGVHVERAEHRASGGFVVTTSAGTWTARNLVVATGHAARAEVPALARELPPSTVQLPASGYRNPDAVGGRVVVVGAGATGQQLAAELSGAGRRVTISVGRHRRLPRSYRGADIWTWLQRLGELDRTVDEVRDVDEARRAPSAALSGHNGGETLDLGVLAAMGVELRGRLVGIHAGRLIFDDSLTRSVDLAEQQMRATLARIDRHATRHGTATVTEKWPGPVHVMDAGPAMSLGRDATVLWATGHRPHNPWLRVDAPTTRGALHQRRGVTGVPGLYVLGLRFQHRRSSHFLGGVGADASDLVQHLVKHAHGGESACHTPAHALALR